MAEKHKQIKKYCLATIVGVVGFSYFYMQDLKIKEYQKLYDRARSIAIKKYGDKRFLLEDFEKEEWYRDMNVEQRNPSKKQLKSFIEANAF